MTLAMCATALASPPRYELIKKFGPDGTASSGFERSGPVAVDQQSHLVYAAAGLPEGGPGSLYKFDTDGTPVNWEGPQPYIAGNEISGIEVAREGERQIAVDSASHVIYITSANSVRAFQANGQPSKFTAGPGAGSSSIGGFLRLSGIAVDVNGFIYASDHDEGLVKIFAPSGEQINQLPVENAGNLAVDSSGRVYVATVQGVFKFTASSFPVTGTTTYVAPSEPTDSKPSYSVAVNHTTNELFVVRGDSHDPGIDVFAADGTPIITFGESGTDGSLNQADGIAVDESGIRVYVGNQPPEGQGELSQVYMFQPEPPAAPKIEVAAVSELGSTSATLFARINPNQKETTYRFEYGLGDCALSVCTTVPIGGASIPGGNDGAWVSEDILGLSAATEYHYRLVAENELGSRERDGVFVTPGDGLGFQLADHRAWEMVSPPNKGGALLVGTSGGLVQAAADGNGFLIRSLGPVEIDPQGNRDQKALARRGASGWSSKDITPPTAVSASPVAGGQGEYKLFSQDLSQALLDPRSETALSPEASERTPYLRENSESPSYRPLVTGKEGFANVPAGTKFGGSGLGGVLIQGATPDLGHVVVSSSVPLVESSGIVPAQSIYEWVAGQLKPISVLPAEKGGELVFAPYPGSGTASMRHAIADDGSRVFWTGPDKHLYMRDMEAEETVQIDKVDPPPSGKVEPIFQGASADGSVVFFTDFRQLTEDSGASFDEGSGKGGNADLYQCKIIQNGSTTECDLHDLTPKVGPEVADIQGLVSGISEDGKLVYFVARGGLSPQPNQFGDAATAGQPNLYLWKEGAGIRFVATLSGEDRADWGLAATTEPPGQVAKLSASTPPSGRYLAFMSERNLTEQETIEVPFGSSVQQVFRYDAAADRLDCISCSPNGAAPQGAQIADNRLVDPYDFWSGRRVAALLPQPIQSNRSGTTIYQPRAMSDNGRMFFNAIDSLVPSDSNGQWDVYQYEPVGVGDCSSSSGGGSISRSSAGCISLISSGAGGEEAGFLDSSETGDDVFFLTSERLAVTDVDSDPDVYDARVNGIAAVQGPPPAECRGESCRSAASEVSSTTPGSVSFSGSGNVKAGRKCPKGKRKVKQGGKERCVTKKHKRSHRSGRARR
jgi:hypothetical protein